MKLLLCPTGHVAVGIKHILIHIDRGGNEERGYALVRDDIAEELLQREGYEIVDPTSYPRDIKQLYTKVRKTLRQESLEKLLDGVSESKTFRKIGSNVPTPVFIPAVWTNAGDLNWPITISYTDASNSPVSFVFTKDFTLPHPCAWCRFKYWVRNKFRRNK